MDMSLYKYMFNTTRIPNIGMDVLCSNPNAKHILVMKGGRMYTFDVLDKNGKIFDYLLFLLII